MADNNCGNALEVVEIIYDKRTLPKDGDIVFLELFFKEENRILSNVRAKFNGKETIFDCFDFMVNVDKVISWRR